MMFMKKIFILAFLFCATMVPAQSNNSKDQKKNLLALAETQYQNGEYAAARHTVNDLLSQNTHLNGADLETARFLSAASAYYLKQMEAGNLLRDFSHQYPTSIYSSKVNCWLANCAMDAGEYEDALSFLKDCKTENLTTEEYYDYIFASATSHLQTGDLQTAAPLFEILKKDSPYKTAATYYSACIAQQTQQYGQAKELFSDLASVEQYQSVVPYHLLQILLETGEYDQVLQLADELMEREDADRKELYRLTAAADFEKKNYPEAKALYQKYLSFQPELSRPDAYRIGMLYFMEENYTQAISYFSKATAGEDAVSQNAIYHLGICYLNSGNDNMARMSFERSSLDNYDPDTKENALFNFALMCYKSSISPFDEQVHAFERILEEFPNSRYSNQIYSYLADAFLSSNNYSAAIAFIDKIEKPSQTLLETRAKLLFLLGVNQFNNGEYKSAVSQFDKSITQSEKIKKSAAEAYFWRGESYFRLDQPEAARLDFSKFIRSNGSSKLKAYPFAHYNLGYCDFNLKDYSGALNAFEKYIKLNTNTSDPTYADALNRIGDCYYQNRDYAKAVQNYKKCDLMSPEGNDYAVFQQAFCKGLEQEYAQKASLLEQFNTRFVESDLHDDALYEQGRAYVAMSQNNKAINSFEKLFNTYPNCDLARKAGLQIGLLYYNQGSNQKAINAYQQIISRYPGSSEAKTAINDLKTIYVATNNVQDYVDYVEALGPSFSIKANEKDSLLYSAAERQMMDGKDLQAVEAFKNYLKQYPTGQFSTDANYHCGQLLFSQNNEEEAIPYLEKVVERTGNQNITQALELLSSYYYERKFYQNALDYYKRLASLADNKDTRIKAQTGMMRCYGYLEQDAELLQVSDELLKNATLSSELQREATYNQSMSLLRMNRGSEAVKGLESLASQPQTAYGAEARFRLADYYFQTGKTDQAEKIAQEFLQEGTSHTYWMARCFILLSDIYLKKGEDFQARQYLLSLRNNYQENDDINGMIEERLAVINSRNNQ